MRYFAFVGDQGIIVRAADYIEEFKEPTAWREIPNIRDHANDNGIQALDAGKRMVFTQQDQSYPQLAALFA